MNIRLVHPNYRFVQETIGFFDMLRQNLVGTAHSGHSLQKKRDVKFLNNFHKNYWFVMKNYLWQTNHGLQLTNSNSPAGFEPTTSISLPQMAILFDQKVHAFFCHFGFEQASKTETRHNENKNSVIFGTFLGGLT